MIVVVDYGMSNLCSVVRALAACGAKVRLTDEPRLIDKAEKLVLPGVGAWDEALEGLQKYRLIGPIKEFIRSGRPYLGICLGLQLLFSRSQEGRGRGLDIFAGEAVRFSPSLKVPHMGWNDIKSKIKNQKSKILRCPLLKGIQDGSYFYFCHSYYVVPEDKSIIAATTDYGLEFASVICKDNIFAIQFHPEKSQVQGLRVIANFSRL